MGTPMGRSAPRARGRRLLSAAGSLSPVAVIAVTLLVVLGGFGIADAATGGSLILGKANKESAKASLSDSRGTPLSLSAPKGKAPLAVNRNVMVPNLNAQYVGGQSASQLKPAGGDDFLLPGSGISVPALAEVRVAKTGSLAAGTYYVSATAQLDLGAGDSGVLCLVSLNGDVDHPLQEGGENGGPFVQAAETVAVSVPAKATVQEWCSIQGSAGGSTVNDAGITAFRIRSSSGTKPAVASHGSARSQAGR